MTDATAVDDDLFAGIFDTPPPPEPTLDDAPLDGIHVDSEESPTSARLADEAALASDPNAMPWGAQLAFLPPPERVDNLSLAERFLLPPFTVLDARQGWWQDRKRQWLALGIRSELGRGENAPDSDGDVEDSLLFRSMGVADSQYYRKKRALEAEIGRTLSPEEFEQMATTRRAAERAEQRATPGGHGTNSAWMRRGADGALRREADRRSNLTGAQQTPEWATGTGTELIAVGTSVFDPVLCEIAYRWFCTPGGSVLDPFAGGSVRGVVAGLLRHHYVGVDLSASQVAANERQWTEIGAPLGDRAVEPRWIVGDSTRLDELLSPPAHNLMHDLVFSCPPYFDLERYSDDPHDLSNASSYEAFLDVYEQVLAGAIARLRDNRFVVLVVGDVRDKRGFYRGLVADSVRICERHGALSYNEAILVQPAGSLPIRMGRNFPNHRKLGKLHQQMIVCYKGDPRAIRAEFGPVPVAWPSEA